MSAGPGFSGRIGVGRRDATPPTGIFSGIWGAADWERSTGTHRPLTVTALHLAGTDTDAGVLLVVLDAGAWRRSEDEWALREALIAATGLTADRVLLHLTHTHSCPSLCPEDSERDGGEHIVPYLEQLRVAAVDAARDALATATPARLDWGVGRSRLASVRDLPADGRYLTGWDPHAVAPATVLVGRVTEESSGRVVATLVNYACHPTTLAWENSLISPDFVGAMRELVEDETSAPCLFLQGSEGDLAPREQYSGDLELADRHGRGLGRAALSALAAMPHPDAADGSGVGDLGAREIGVEHRSARLPLKPVEGIPELAARFWPDLDPHTRESRVRRAEWRRRQAGTGESADFPLWVWRLGGAILVAQPGETYSAFQEELRRRHPDVPIIVLSLTNGPIWTYFPTRELFDLNVYQVWHTPFQEGGHEEIVELADTMIGALG